jgi:hypothetical protein
MQQACPGWKPSCFIVDAAPAQINAIRKVFGDSVKIFICTWHFFKALKKNLWSKVRSVSACFACPLRKYFSCNHTQPSEYGDNGE